MKMISGNLYTIDRYGKPIQDFGRKSIEDMFEAKQCMGLHFGWNCRWLRKGQYFTIRKHGYGIIARWKTVV